MPNRRTVSPIVVEVDDTPTTSYAGLLPYLELWQRLGMPRLTCLRAPHRLIEECVAICGQQGWTDRQEASALGTLNVAGGRLYDRH